jgi:hypothetical protein
MSHAQLRQNSRKTTIAMTTSILIKDNSVSIFLMLDVILLVIGYYCRAIARISAIYSSSSMTDELLLERDSSPGIY